MQRLVLIGVCLLCGNAMTAAQNEQPEAVEIPLDKIWGYNMPGTRDLQKIEGRLTAKQWEGIRRALSTPPPQGKEAALGFAVVGAGPDALREVHAVLAEGKKPRQTFPPDNDISLVFFSYQFSHYVQLRSVSLRGNVVEIRFQFVPHKTKEITEHFALIPLSKLRPGKVQVEIVKSPMPQEFVSAGWKPVSADTARRIVCRSFSFIVK